MTKLIDAMGILALAVILTGFVIVPVAFAVAIFTTIFGVAVAPWVGTAIAFPIAIYAARNVLAAI